MIDVNRDAQQPLCRQTRLEIVNGTTHLFEEPGALEAVTDLACEWFLAYLGDRERTRT